MATQYYDESDGYLNRTFSYDQYNMTVPVSDEAVALCAFVNATNINSIYDEWRCDNTDNRCSNWTGITCDSTGSIFQINLGLYGIFF
jgi:hypothetical protein